MFKKGDIIMHSKAGVCKVLSIKKNVNSAKPRDKYYELEPVYTKGTTILTPVENDKINLRPLYSQEELDLLIKEIPNLDGEWVDDQKQRKNVSETIISSGDIQQLIEFVSTLYAKRRERKEEGKQLNIADKNNLKFASNLINEEFAYVFDVDMNKVEDFISEKIDALSK